MHKRYQSCKHKATYSIGIELKKSAKELSLALNLLFISILS